MKYGVIVVILVLAVGGYFLYGKSSSTESAPADSSATTETSTTGGDEGKGTAFKGSVADLVAKNTPIHCVIPEASSQADLYVAGGKMRLDVVVKSPKGEVLLNGHSLFDGSTFYSWDSLRSEGTKVSLSFSDLVKRDQTFASATEGYLCSPWKVDSKFFVPPQGITFSAE